MSKIFSREYNNTSAEQIEMIEIAEDSKRINRIVDNMNITCYKNEFISYLHEDCYPTKECIEDIMNRVIKCIFPSAVRNEVITGYVQKKIVTSILTELSKKIENQVFKAYLANSNIADIHVNDFSNLKDISKEITLELLEEFPEFRLDILRSAEMAYQEDPAACSFNEVILSYPFLKVITIHRIAHFLYKKKVPIIPRMMSEYIHSQTGIDIHPGAKIGRSLFIDHGTGIVIGETSEIGDNVKIYHGVTLGAISFEKNETNGIVKGKKRHPTIHDNVTIYANATVLGGDTIIGANSIIGGNSWISKSVPADTIVSIDRPNIKHHFIK